jgi:translation initiation factor IF-2
MDDPRPATHALARVLARARRPAVVAPTSAAFEVVEAPPDATRSAADAPPPRGPRPVRPVHFVPSPPATPSAPAPERPSAPGGASRPDGPEPPVHEAGRIHRAAGREPEDPWSLPEVEVILDPPSRREEPAPRAAVDAPGTSDGRGAGTVRVRPVAHADPRADGGDGPAGGPPAGALTVPPGTPPDQPAGNPPAPPRPDDPQASRRTPTDLRPAGTSRPDAPSREPAPPSIVIERIDISSPPPAGPAADPLASLAGRRRGRSRPPAPQAH